MTALRLIAGDLNYSTWTMRAWLALEEAGAEYKLFDVGLRVKGDWKERIRQFSGAGKVPVLVDGSLTIHESLAICEYVAELYPAAKLWPEDRSLRARGRAISSEMLSSFGALRTHMPMNLRARGSRGPLPEAVREDIARILEIWEASLATSNGDFLLGDFSIADCMFFPIAGRFRTYGISVPDYAKRYSDALFARPSVQKLEALAAGSSGIPIYDQVLHEK